MRIHRLMFSVTLLALMLSASAFAQAQQTVGSRSGISTQVIEALEQAQIFPSDPAASDYFGRSAALDGNTFVIGAHFADHSSITDAGAAYVFTGSGSSWTQQQKLIAPDPTGSDLFGVDLDVEGDIAVMGAPGHTVMGEANAGAVYIYTRSAGVWTLDQKIVSPTPDESDGFGQSVSLDGTTLAIGVLRYTHSGYNGAGAVMVYTYDGTDWVLEDTLTASDARSGDQLGGSVALQGDTLFAAAQRDDNANGSNAGAVYVFERTGMVWNQAHQFIAPDGATEDRYGVGLALNGVHAMVGASLHNGSPGVDSGAVYYYRYDGSNWVYITKINAFDGDTEDRFGSRIAIDGTTALISAASEDSPSSSSPGQVYVYLYDGSAWNFHVKFLASDEDDYDSFGSAVALDGDVAVIGSHENDTASGADAGAAYVFDELAAPAPAAPSLISPADTTNTPDTTPDFVWSDVASATHYVITLTGVTGPMSYGLVYTADWLDTALCDGSTCTLPATLSGINLLAGLHEWNVFAYNSNGISPLSDTFEFTVDVTATVGTLNAPSGVVNSLTPNFSFDEGTDAIWYQVDVFDNVPSLVFSETYLATDICVAGVCTLTDPVTLDEPAASTTDPYTWQVTPYNVAMIAGTPSAVANFSNVNNNVAPATPNAIYPDNVCINDTTPTFEFTEVSDAYEYGIWLAFLDGIGDKANEDYEDHNLYCDGSSCMVPLSALDEVPSGLVTVPQPLTEGLYAWWVRAWNVGIAGDPSDLFSPWSATPIYFYVDELPYSCFALPPSVNTSAGSPLPAFMIENALQAGFMTPNGWIQVMPDQTVVPITVPSIAPIAPVVDVMPIQVVPVEVEPIQVELP